MCEGVCSWGIFVGLGMLAVMKVGYVDLRCVNELCMEVTVCGFLG